MGRTGCDGSALPGLFDATLYVLSQVGLALYMFCVGLEFRADQLLVHGKRAWAVSTAGVVVPFALGGLIAFEMVRAGGFFTEKVRLGAAVLFLGASMSITAFPMLARIIYERSMVGTPVGTLALAAGAMDDAAAWIILACVLGSVDGNGWIAGRALLGGLLYVGVAIFVLRPMFVRAAAHAETVGSLRPWIVSWVLAALALGAWFTDLIGIHAIRLPNLPSPARHPPRRHRGVSERVEPTPQPFPSVPGTSASVPFLLYSNLSQPPPAIAANGCWPFFTL